jgi:hypothetical protein
MSIRLIILLLIVTFFTFIPFAFSEEPEKTEKVVVNGIGIDADKARNNAIRNAIEQVIGTYVTSDTMVKNSQLIKDEILGYSGGYVKDSRVVSSEKNDDGLFSVKLEAVVVSTKLKRKIQDLNIATVKVAGESLFGEAFSKIEQKKGGAELVGKVIAKYPQAAYQFEVGKPTVVNTDHTNGKANIKIPLVIKWDTAFLAELRSALAQASSKEFSSISIKSFERGKNQDFAKENQIICFATHGTKRSGRANGCYALDWSVVGRNLSNNNGIRNLKALDKANTLLKLPSQPNSFSLYLSFKDAEGKDLITETYKFTYDDDYRKRPSERQPGPISSFLKGVFGGDDSATDTEEAPKTRKTKKAKSSRGSAHNDGANGEYTDKETLNLVEGKDFAPPGILWNAYKTEHLMLIEDAAFKMSVVVPVDVEKLKEVVKIEVSMNGFE